MQSKPFLFDWYYLLKYEFAFLGGVKQLVYHFVDMDLTIGTKCKDFAKILIVLWPLFGLYFLYHNTMY